MKINAHLRGSAHGVVVNALAFHARGRWFEFPVSQHKFSIPFSDMMTYSLNPFIQTTVE